MMEQSGWTMYSVLGAIVCVAGGNTTCGPPPSVEGTAPLTLEGTSHALDTVVTYKCDFGYLQRGPRDFQSKCELDLQSTAAKWTEPSAKCIPRSCGDPGFVLYADRVGDLFTFPNEVEFHCAEGYRLEGQGVRFCQASGDWSGSLPECEKIVCGPPNEPANGRISFDSLEYGARLRYSCRPGFTISGHRDRTCTGNGTWSDDDPKCVETKCDAPTAPEHGTVQVVGESIRVNSLATYACDDGWALEGTSVAKCLDNGQWTFPAPKCFAPCVVPEVSNGNVGRIPRESSPMSKPNVNSFEKFGAGEAVEHGREVEVECYEGYEVVSGTSDGSARPDRSGNSRARCENGTWTRTWQCVPGECLGDAPAIQNGRAVVNSRSNGHVIWYACNKGHVRGRTGHIQCVQGAWKGHTPLCVDGKGRIPRVCYSRDLDGTGIVAPSVEYMASGESHPVSCVEGYGAPEPSKTVDCRRGMWLVPKEACVEDVSVRPPEATSTTTHRSRPLPEEERVPRQSVIPRACSYLHHDRTLVAEVAGRSLRHGDRVGVGETLRLRCRDPSTHQLWPNGLLTSAGPTEMTCSRGENWEARDLPSCVHPQQGDSWITWEGPVKLQPGGRVEIEQNENVTVHCQNLETGYPTWNTPVHLYFIYAAGIRGGRRQFSSSFVVSRTGHRHSGNYSCSITQFNGRSKASTMDIRIKGKVTCPRIPYDFDLIVIYKDLDRSENSVAEFSCRSIDQKIVGPRNRTCQPDGKWSEGNPTCVDVSCSAIPKIDRLEVTYTGGLKPLSFARFQCEPPATLEGNTSSMCQFNGSWTHPPPACRVPGCLIGDLMELVPENLVPSMEGVSEELQPLGTALPLQCEQGLFLSGQRSAMCGTDGRWRFGNAECVMGCRFEEEHLSDGTLLVEPLKEFYRFGEFALLACPEGMQLADSVQRLMCVGNRWSDAVPSCTSAQDRKLL